MELYVCLFSFTKQIFPLVEMKIYGELKKKPQVEKNAEWYNVEHSKVRKLNYTEEHHNRKMKNGMK